MMEQLLEYFGVLTGLLYLFLEIRQHRAMWVVGFLTSLVYVFVFFLKKGLCRYKDGHHDDEVNLHADDPRNLI